MAHGIDLPPNFAMPQQVTMTPMNDVQVTAMLAAMLWNRDSSMTAGNAVDAAIEVLAESVLRAKSGRLMERVRELEVLRKVTTDA